jgi:integrase
VGQLHRPRQDVCHPSSRRTPAAGVARRQRCPAPIRPAAAEQRAAIPGDHADAIRLRGLIVVLWRAGLRISEALALNESDLDRSRGAILVRRGKGGKRREVGMDRSAWEQLNPWLQLRSTLPVGALFCVLRGATRGRPWAPAGVRSQQPRPERVCGAASHHTSFGTLMPSRCRARECRCSSSSASPAIMLTLRSRRGTCAESITPRSSTPSTNAQRR